MSINSLQELKRIAESLDKLREQFVEDVVVRADRKQMRITLSDGQILLVSAMLDEDGYARLDVDIVKPLGETDTSQLEVRFDPDL